MDRILTEDINEFVNNSNYPPSLGSGRWLVTGATGLIGASLVHYLLAYYPSIEIFCPLRNLRKANFMVTNFNQNIVVREELHLDYGYAPETKLHLSTSKLRALGWEPYYDLRSMLERLIISMKEQQ